MKLRNLLSTQSVLVGVKASNLEEVQALLLDLLAAGPASGLGAKRSLVESLLAQRSALGGTVFPSGIAIPHARIPGLSELRIAFATLAKPLSKEGAQIRLVALFLIPEEGSKFYLSALNFLIKHSQNPQHFEAWVGAKTQIEFLNSIDSIEISKPVLVRDIMQQITASVLPGSTLKEAVDAMYTAGLDYLPVIDESGDFVGELGLPDIFKQGLPDYAMRIGELAFAQSFEPFEELIRNEEKITIAEIMQTPNTSLAGDDTVYSAALGFVKFGRSHIPVLEDGKLVGLLMASDILRNIIRV